MRAAVVLGVAAAGVMLLNYRENDRNLVGRMTLPTAMIFASTVCLGIVRPVRAWRWALLVSMGMPVIWYFKLGLDPNTPENWLVDVGTIIGMSVASAFLGAYSGALVGAGWRRVFPPAGHHHTSRATPAAESPPAVPPAPTPEHRRRRRRSHQSGHRSRSGHGRDNTSPGS